MNCKIDFYQIVNNELRSSELITKKVELNSSADFYAKTIKDIDVKYGIECLRKVDNIYYAIFDTDKHGLLFLVFSNIYGLDSVNDYYVASYFFSDSSLYLDSFDTLIVNNSTIDEVMQIDPFGSFIYGLGRTDINDYSFHITNDGYSVYIDYNEDKILDINKKKDEHFILNYILPIDL